MSFKMHVVKTRMHITKCISCPSSVTGGFKPNVFCCLARHLTKGTGSVEAGLVVETGTFHMFVCQVSWLTLAVAVVRSG